MQTWVVVVIGLLWLLTGFLSGGLLNAKWTQWLYVFCLAPLLLLIALMDTCHCLGLVWMEWLDKHRHDTGDTGDTV